MVEAKKLILLGITLAGIVLFGLSYVVADTGTSNNEANSSMSKPKRRETSGQR
jgi:hypothetical protein